MSIFWSWGLWHFSIGYDWYPIRCWLERWHMIRSHYPEMYAPRTDFILDAQLGPLGIVFGISRYDDAESMPSPRFCVMR